MNMMVYGKFTIFSKGIIVILNDSGDNNLADFAQCFSSCLELCDFTDSSTCFRQKFKELGLTFKSSQTAQTQSKE